jgi:hypothetical protein
LNIIVSVNAGVNVIAIAVYRTSACAITIAGASIIGINGTSTITGAVSIYQCFGVVSALINQCLAVCPN